MKISFIIPVYNCERYIIPCLESIYNQHLATEEFEVICVDDCSIDSSPVLLHSFQESHSNLRIITHEKNKKTSTTLNDGLKAAKGEYVWMIDNDDLIEPDCTKRLLDICDTDKLDLLLFNYKCVDASGENVILQVPVFSNSEVQRGEDFVHTYFADSFCAYLLGDRWRAIFRKQFLLDNEICFVDGSLYDDSTFLFKSIWLSLRMKSIEDFLYYYRHSDYSTTDSSKRLRGDLVYEFSFVAGKEIYDYSQEIVGEKEKQALFNQSIQHFKTFATKVIKMPIIEKKIFYNRVKENKTFIKEIKKYLPFSYQLLLVPMPGIILSSVLRPAILIKHRISPKTYFNA